MKTEPNTGRRTPTPSRPLIYARALRDAAVALGPSYVAHAHGTEGTELVIVDELPPTLRAFDAVGERALRLVGVRHPDLATVREVLTKGGARLVVSDFVDGECLDEVCARTRPPVEVSCRIVLDVLAALSALHELDAPIVHGHVGASNVIVGTDGVTRLVRAHLGAGEGAGDPRADLVAAGTLLEGLLPEDVPTWATSLADVISKARANDAREGFVRPADMAREIQLLAQSHVASRERVVAFVDQIAGERIARRRAELVAPSQSRLRSSPSVATPPDPPTAEPPPFVPAGRTQPMARVALPASSPPVSQTQPMPRVATPAAQPASKRGPSSRNAPTAAYRVPVQRSPRWIALLVFLVLFGGGVFWLQRSSAKAPVVPAALTAAPPDPSIVIPTERSPEAPPPSVPPTSKAPPRGGSKVPADRSAIF